MIVNDELQKMQCNSDSPLPARVRQDVQLLRYVDTSLLFIFKLHDYMV